MISFIETNRKESIRKDEFHIIVPSVGSKQELFSKLAEMLHFPYFGYNWDALIELLRDFYWIDTKKIIIEHTDISRLPISDLKTYIEITIIVCKFWEEYENHDVYFLFSSSVYEIFKNFFFLVIFFMDCSSLICPESSLYKD